MKQKFDWSTIWILSLAGAIMGGLTLTGILTTMGELGAWTLIAVAAWVPVVVMRRTPRPFVTLTLVGTLAGVWTGAIQGFFAHALLDANAAYAASFPAGATAANRAILAVSALATGAVWGALFGGIAWGIRKVRDKRAPEGVEHAG